MDKARADDFADFAQTRWSRLVRLAYGITGDRGLAEDLAQTALANAFASWARVRRADDPDAYVRRILLNAHSGGLRKRRVAEHLSDDPPAISSADFASQHCDRAAIIAALQTLPRRQREVLVLRYWMDLTEAQTAQTLGCSVGNVKSQASRALSRLRGSMTLVEGSGQ